MLDKKVIFILRGEKARELMAAEPQTIPLEFSFGYNEVKEKFNCDYIVLPNKINTFFPRLLKFLERIFSKFTKLGFPLYAYLLLEKEDKDKLKKADLIFCGDEAVGFPFLLYKKMGFIKGKVIILVMSLPERIKYFKDKTMLINFIAMLFKKADKVLTLSKYVFPVLKESFNIPEEKMDVMYFGIDTNFWQPLRNNKKENFILSIGNDINRDFKTLVEALPPNLTLKLITKSKIDIKNKKIEILSGISDQEVRELYNKCLFVVVPSIKLKNESSGLSCCLQSMACQRPVLISDAPPLREIFEDKKECLFYEPENVQDLKEKIELLINNEKLREDIGRNGYVKTTTQFTLKKMGEKLKDILLNFSK